MLSFPATIEIKGVDRLGVLCEIIRTITEEHAINISKLNVDTKDGIFELFVTLYVHDVEDVNNLCMALMKNSNVSSVNRVELNMGGR
jgi:GTP pyrophosphokinase